MKSGPIYWPATAARPNPSPDWQASGNLVLLDRRRRRDRLGGLILEPSDAAETFEPTADPM
jgi:hypothetical protein